MGWTWTFEYADGGPVTPRPPAATNEEFAQQADAESWLGEAFRELLEQGVAQVTLVHDGAIAYSMSLHPPQ
jgi:hypothetical protein